MNRKKLLDLAEKLNGPMEPLGFRCIEIEQDLKGQVLRIFIDFAQTFSSAENPVQIDDCVKVSEVLNELEFLDSWVTGPYHLEVSSPGVERPLRFVEDFRHFIGENAVLKFRENIHGGRRFEGRIAGVFEETSEISLEGSEGSQVFPLDRLMAANLKYDWNSHF